MISVDDIGTGDEVIVYKRERGLVAATVSRANSKGKAKGQVFATYTKKIPTKLPQ